jgi:hypothetical protein
MTWIYLRTGSDEWTVGFCAPDGSFIWDELDRYDLLLHAAQRVHYLNGGDDCGLTLLRDVLAQAPATLRTAIGAATAELHQMRSELRAIANDISYERATGPCRD